MSSGANISTHWLAIVRSVGVLACSEEVVAFCAYAFCAYVRVNAVIKPSIVVVKVERVFKGMPVFFLVRRCIQKNRKVFILILSFILDICM